MDRDRKTCIYTPIEYRNKTLAMFQFRMKVMLENLSAAIDMERLSRLVKGLKNCRTDLERIEIFNQDPHVKSWMEKPSAVRTFLASLSQECELIIKSLVAIGQEEHLFQSASTTNSISEPLRAILEELFPVETFYKEIGGIVGYHFKLISLFSKDKQSFQDVEEFYYQPPGIDIASADENVAKYIDQGLISLPKLGEIYPVGGAADRLQLFDEESGQLLPAAKLTFCGHSLLEGLIRDVQAREYLYFKRFKEQITIPIAMMTSSEKENHRHIQSLCNEKKWFGRSKASFRFFCQPLVPTIEKEGKWCLSGPMKLLMKPGGHGVLWKLAKQEGVLDWLESLGKTKLIVRQINNPVAGTDGSFLAFAGVGFQGDKIFGFASCPRQVLSAEGINILIHRKPSSQNTYCLTNIEYCDFSKFSIQDIPEKPGSLYSQFPSNTNILFADIDCIKETVKHCPIPGMLVNLKKISYPDEEGFLKTKEVARLESTMQNIADHFEESIDPTCSLKGITLKTFLTYNVRRKTISTIKKLHQKESSLLETPEGCFYDLMQNAHDLLSHYCHISVPDMPDAESYIKNGPSFIFHFHPALGPLYSIIAQKFRGGRFGDRSELNLEIAEVDIVNLDLSGSLHVIADQILGESDPEGIIRYSDRVGKCRLINVKVENQGIDFNASNTYWKANIHRSGLCEIIIHGDGEFYAENVLLPGNLKIEVESGTRLTAFEEKGILNFRKEPV